MQKGVIISTDCGLLSPMNPIGRADSREGKGFTQTEWPWRTAAAEEEKILKVTATVLTFKRKLGVRLPTLLPAVIFGGERVVLVQS